MKWWERYNPDFKGMKIIGKGEFPGCHSAGVIVRDSFEWYADHIHGGGNSGFQALNLVARWGAKDIILTGYDFQNAGNHWHGWHPREWGAPREETMKTWARCIRGAAAELRHRGYNVINATRDTALECFPRMSMEEALDASCQ